MSRIQDILSKAERDGTVRRTRALSDEYASRPADEGVPARAFVDSAPAARTLHDEARLRSPEPPREAPPIPDASRQPPCGVPSRRSRTSRARRLQTPGFARQIEPAPEAGHLPAYAPEIEGTPRVTTDLDHHLVAALAPTSLAAEQYRSLRTRLKRVESGRALRTIAVTSPNKGDGKSLTAANLALTMAQEFQHRVLLIDCDLRRPSRAPPLRHRGRAGTRRRADERRRAR